MLYSIPVIPAVFSFGSETLGEIEKSYYIDPVEMAQIRQDETLQEKLAAGHRDAAKMKGRLVE